MTDRSNRRLAGMAAAALLLAAPVVGSAATKAAAPRPAARPNVVVIVFDDMGYSDVGAFGSEIRTPNIDSLAKAGLRYTRFDTNAICSATRASLLTGRNSHTVKIGALATQGPNVPNMHLRGRPAVEAAASRWAPQFRDPANQSSSRGWMPENAQNLAQVLKQQGYATFAIGKWHLAPNWEDGSKGNNVDLPLQRGFDYFYGYRDGWDDQFKPDIFENNSEMPTPTYGYGQMLASDLTDHAVTQLQKNEKTSPGKPFFLYLAYTQMHAPHQVTQPYIDAYNGVYDKGWDEIRRARFEKQKALGVIPKNAALAPPNPADRPWSSLSAQQKRIYARFMQTYAGELTYGDEQVGRVLTYLKRTGQDKNTIVVFVSDNGPASAGGNDGDFFYQMADNTKLDDMERHLDELGGPNTEPTYQREWATVGAAPYRRWKASPFLGGVRDEMIVSWPGHVADPGGVRDQYVHALDVAPTLAAAAGTQFADSVKGVKQLPVAGKSFLASLSDANAPSQRTTQYFLLNNNRAITSGDWRAVATHRNGQPFENDVWELFDLKDDPSETKDLSKQNPAKLAEMKALWQSEAERYGGLPLKDAAAIGE